MLTCAHCDEAAPTHYFNPEDKEKRYPFCCYGCMTVFNVIHQKGLGAYYDIKKQSSIYKRRSPVELRSSQYQYLDEEQFQKEYCSHSEDGGKMLEFYLEGIHCLACLWLIEKLPEILPSIQSSKLNLERSVVRVVLQKNGKFSEVASELDKLGYRPHPLKQNDDVSALKIKEERSFLIRIGVAGAAAGNIMIYAVSLYGGATSEFSGLFNLLTVIFAIPVLTYCAYPLYQNAWSAIRNRTLSIDVPISLSLIIGGVMGFTNLIKGVPDNYFDSLTALVFLLLLSRYFLHKIQEKGLSAQDLHFFYHSDSVLRATSDQPDNFSPVHPQFVKVGDVLKIGPGELIPVDGMVLKGSSNVNNSLLTGESLPVKVTTGTKVYSGTQNLDHELMVKVEEIQGETRLGKILKNVENGWSSQAPIVTTINKISKYFTLIVLGLSGLLFALHLQKGDIASALEYALTLMIVTCPCALALAVPLTFTRSLSRAAREGIIIKSDDVIERINRIKNIFLDKTGTLTYGKLKVTSLDVLKLPVVDVFSVIASLESNSRHPVAVALKEHVKNYSPIIQEVGDRQEIIGVGVSGNVGGHFYEINKNGIFEDHTKIATFVVTDTLRSEAGEVLASLNGMGVVTKLLSGDRRDSVFKMARDAGLPTDQALAGLSPEEKSSLVESIPNSMMIGDGANDAIALAKADVGVAVLGSMDISLRAADVYLTTPGLMPVEKLMVLSQETMKVVYRNLVLSLLYNSLSVTAAFLGIINPLMAAIIMPLSSLTVLISTLMGTKKMRQLWK
jgi:Cu2+-exporting ATPase/Cu+-exporting ATPase